MFPERARPSHWHPLVLVALALSAWVYYPITRTFFFADDFVHLTEITNESTLVFLLRPFGGQPFLVRNLVFLGTYGLFGTNPVGFMWTVLLAHLLNVWLFFAFVRALGRSAWLACVGAVLFGTSPIAVGTLNWYAAFGHVLVGTVLLLVLNGVARVAVAGGPIPTRAAVTWYALLLVGCTCYGTGLGMTAAFPAALVLLLPAAWWQRGVRLAFLALPAVMLGLYFGLRRLYTLVGVLPIEDLIQQAMAWSGFGNAPMLLANLLGYSGATTVLGFWSRAAYPTRASWVALVTLAVGIGFALARGTWATRRQVVAMVALWVGGYVVVAIGRANIYAAFKIPPAAAASIGRYHYAGTIPLVAVVCIVLHEIGRLPGLRAVPRGLAAAAILAVWVAGYLGGNFTIDERRKNHDYFVTTLNEIMAAAAAAPGSDPVYLENGASPGYILGPMIPDRFFPGRAALFLITHPGARLDGRELRFIERDPMIVEWYRHPVVTVLGRLLVAPGDVPTRP